MSATGVLRWIKPRETDSTLWHLAFGREETVCLLDYTTTDTWTRSLTKGPPQSICLNCQATIRRRLAL